MDPDLVHRLSTGEGWGLLQSLPPYEESRALSLGLRLRSEGFDPDLVAAALTQSRLRLRGREKFGDRVEQMLLTPDGVEQATRAELAARHAERFTAAGVEVLWDLGCGIGADAMAAAGAGLRVRAVDADPVTAAVAAVNLRPFPEAEVSVDTAERVQLRLPSGRRALGCGVWFDPARRLPGVTGADGRTRRVFRLEQLSPSWDTVTELAAALPAVGAKLSPGFPHGRVPMTAEAQWSSFGGEALECTIWWGDTVRTPGRTAQVHTRRGWVEVAPGTDEAHRVLPGPARLGGWLYEPDRAVLQAGLVGTLVEAVDGAELDTGVGYVTSERSVELPWASRFRLLDSLPLHTKALRAFARAHGIGRLTIKKRGVRVDADALRRQLRLKGEVEAVVVITRIAGRPMVLHVVPS